MDFRDHNCSCWSCPSTTTCPSSNLRFNPRRPTCWKKTLVALAMIAAHSRGRHVRAFSVLKQNRKNFLSSKSQILKAAESSSSSSGAPTTNTERGLILPSHPDFPILSVMAPMVAASDYPFRHFLREHCGVQLTYTQMIHSKNFCNDAQFRKTHLDLWEAGATYEQLLPSQIACFGIQDKEQVPVMTGRHHRGAPVMVQLAGHDVELVVEAALRIMDHTNGGVTGFDLNCGCPQHIAKKGRYGAFLMEENDALVCDILKALRKALPSTTAISAKIRLPLDDATLKDRIPRLVQTGINFMTIHGRTLVENKTKVGAVHTDRIRLAVQTAKMVDPNFPIVANGGMETYQDVQDILQATGAVAAMSSEALLETPNIFQPESMNLSHRERMETQFGFANKYLDICSTVAPPLPGVLGSSKHKGGSFNVLRGHLFKFLHRYLQEHIDLRDRLAPEGRMASIPQARAVVDELYERHASIQDGQWEGLESSAPEASWYRRHRKSRRFVHQKEILLDSVYQPSQELSLEERKRQIQQRIQQLKVQNKERAESNVQRFIS